MFLILFWILSLALSECARILVVVPWPSLSHQVVFYPLTKELAKRGHEVVFITTDPAFPKGQAPTNLTEIDLHDISYNFFKHHILKPDVTTGSDGDLKTQIPVIFPNLARVFEVEMMTDEVQNLIRSSTHFDLLILEASVKSTLSLAHVFKAPVVLMNSFGSMLDFYDIVGAPKNPRLIYPYCLHQKVYNVTLWEKMKVLYDVFAMESFFTVLRKEEDAIAKRLFGPDTPSLQELGKRVEMVFLNVYPIWEMNRPVPPNVVFIGGIHNKPEKQLPEDLKAYLDSSKFGVIYISFGTNVNPSMLPPERIQVLINVLSKLPYDVLWKWDTDKVPVVKENIKFAKWFPQSDLLRHPKVKLFIMQGGLQSTDEALTAGVPLLGMPMFGDQWFNVEMYKVHKIGIGLALSTITEDSFKEAVETIIEDPSYRRNLISLRDKIHDQPQTALDRAVWWIEHIIRHRGASHLRAPTAHMSWSEYLDVELLSVFLLAAVATVIVLATLLYWFRRLVTGLFNFAVKLKYE